MKWICALLICIKIPLVAFGQLEIIVDQVPINTPERDTIFIVGSFNDWDPDDHTYFLVKQTDGVYSALLDITDDYIEFKFTRGSWSNVEGGANGSPLANRSFFKDHGKTGQLLTRIKSWEDQEDYLISISGVPENTPFDASLYVAGDFNNWTLSDPKYQLKRTSQGLYETTINPQTDTIQYKFNRGNWDAVETDANGRPIANRVAVISEFPKHVIDHSIAGWKDLNVKSTNFLTLLLGMSIIQGLFILIIVNTESTDRFRRNAYFSMFLVSFCLMLSAKFVVLAWDIFSVFPKLLLLQDFFVFLIAPVLLTYLRKMVNPDRKMGLRGLLLFIPIIAQVIYYFPYFIMSNYDFTMQVVNHGLDTFYIYFSGLALVYNGIYLGYILSEVNLMKTRTADSQTYEDFEGLKSYINTLVSIFAITLVVALFTFSVSLFGWFSITNTQRNTELGLDLIWSVFSLYGFVIIYFLIAYPQIFKKNWAVVSSSEQSNNRVVSVELKQQMTDLMTVKKPYLNPRLTLAELSELLDTNVHELSHAINEGYGMNFFDFVNTYRIEKFKEKVQDPIYKNHTFLAVAFESGFSSKTTFNRAFKKITNMTPREYQSKQEKIDARV